ncbi:thioredoxin domain-containing protein 17-like [Pomacea canaliculata]|uniref:thioredoxin domain-containing protein 17-like n=1 Tax=Pomacea canaliculata TaxID=400727 RepID=UPI000D73383B|nr:thioredoxin domain-containing protein 17-like [Pomacea canaliculata]
MVKEILVEGYEEYVKAAAENKGKQVFALFSGSKDANGESWCPDCLTADPVIKDNLKYAPADAILIHCGVGKREFWKDKENVFRKDPKLLLKCVPTLLKLGTPQRLEEAQCADENLVQMFFEED